MARTGAPLALACAAWLAACGTRDVTRSDAAAGDAGTDVPVEVQPDSPADVADAREAGEAPRPDGPYPCATSAACLPTERCADGFCVLGGRFGGDVCSSPAVCLSGFCTTAGVCCDLGCKGGCQNCTLPGKVGVCSAVDKGTADPKCGPYLCGGAPSCPEACVGDGDCATGTPCTAGRCGHPDGTPCTSATLCRSGTCRSGVCCDGPCLGVCSSCTLAGAVGMCRPLPKGTDVGSCGIYRCNGTDGGCPAKCADDGGCAAGLVCGPDGRCGRPLATSCSYDGECASGFCRSSVCCDTACSDGCASCTQAGSIGTCKALPVGSPASPCGAYLCDGGLACPATCMTGADCAPGSVCGGSRCGKPLASPCAYSSECLSDWCVGYVCCDKPCSGGCGSCKLAGSIGTCTPLAKGSIGSCGSFLCDGGASCPTKCAGNADCVPGSVCGGTGHCGKTLGASCYYSSECASEHCKDGFCCDTACDTPCSVCNRPGSIGACSKVTSGKDYPECSSGSWTCDADGVCVTK